MISVADSRVARQNRALHWGAGEDVVAGRGKGAGGLAAQDDGKGKRLGVGRQPRRFCGRAGKGSRFCTDRRRAGRGTGAPLCRSRQPSLLWETDCRGNRTRLFFGGSADFVGDIPLLTLSVQIDMSFTCRVRLHGSAHGGRTDPFDLQGVARAGCRWGNARIGASPSPSRVSLSAAVGIVGRAAADDMADDTAAYGPPATLGGNRQHLVGPAVGGMRG